MNRDLSGMRRKWGPGEREFQGEGPLEKRHKKGCGLMGTDQRNVGNMANSEVVGAPKLCP